jgi:hypothetical protein
MKTKVATDGRRVVVTLNIKDHPIEHIHGRNDLVTVSFSATDAQEIGWSLEAAGTHAKWEPPKARKRRA